MMKKDAKHRRAFKKKSTKNMIVKNYKIKESIQKKYFQKEIEGFHKRAFQNHEEDYKAASEVSGLHGHIDLS